MKSRFCSLFFAIVLFTLNAAPLPGAAENLSIGFIKAGSLTIKTTDITLTPKDAYVHVLFDAYPYRQALKLDSPTPPSLTPLAQSLAENAVLPLWPATQLVKIDVVEFTKRDEYGTPRWDSIKRLGKFEVRMGHHKFSVKRVPIPGETH